MKNVLKKIDIKPVISWVRVHLFKILMLLVVLLISNSYLNYLEEKNKLAELKYQDERKQEEKEYTSKRKDECYDIYERERKAYSNVLHTNYNESDDVCVVTYKATANTWKGIDCNDFTPDNNITSFKTRLYLLEQKSLCEAGEFTKEF